MAKIITRVLIVLLLLAVLLACGLRYYITSAAYSDAHYLETKAFVETIAAKYAPLNETLAALERNHFDCVKTGFPDHSGPEYMCYRMLVLPAFMDPLNYTWVVLLNQSGSEVWVTVLTHERFE